MVPRFPCYQNKRPACANGFKDASADPARIAALWAGRSGLLVGVPTGKGSGLAVLDIDRAGLPWLAVHRDQLPPTRQHETRSGGLHFVFRHRPGLRCSQGLIAPGVDVRAEGGYAIWWAAHGWPIENEGVIAEWPEWLPANDPKGARVVTSPLPIDGLPPPTTIEREVTTFAPFRKTVPRWSPEESHCLVSARNARDRLAKTPIDRGLRNEALNGEAFALGRQVARGWINGGEALLWLWLGAQGCRYDRDRPEERCRG